MGDNLMKESFKFKENKWTFFGWSVIGLAILAPTFLLLFRDSIVIDFNNLGPIGDFFGGTTVGLLTLASMLFVISSISMQKKQLGMQQEELKMQREELAKTREEFELTNRTLTKQQFESTFFNMINLHHNLLKDLEGGRKHISVMYENLYPEYKFAVSKHWEGKLHSLRKVDPDRLFDFLESMFWFDKSHNLFLEEFEKMLRNDVHNTITWDDELIKNMQRSSLDAVCKDENFKKELDIKLKRDINSLIEKYANDHQIRLFFKERHKNLSISAYSRHAFKLEEIYNDLKDDWSIFLLNKTREQTLLNPWFSLKRKAYEKMYKEMEEEIGHYYRNLYRIMKFIHDEQFSNNSKENELEKKKYRGILRAQLSSMELLMLFYNVVYSEKGEKFKDILKGTNFFDDHLIESNFLWANDKEELATLK
ncbi:putative phage abortive infection protein [Bacillus pumilus]|uniref:putative phage abortive infection protein n=1 Tax=Bacillus pumilus TaxID=1408 RepID=UPI002FFE5791